MMYGICYIRAQKHRQFTHQKLKAKREIYLVLRELCPYEQRGHKSFKNNPKFVNDESMKFFQESYTVYVIDPDLH